MERGQFESRHPLVGLVDETIRLNSRLRSVFAAVRAEFPLNDSESMVLNAVVEADRAPTAAQIARSMGTDRQLVQRAANALREKGLIDTADNPDHKRAPLLVPTEAGVALKRESDARAETLAEDLLPAGDLDAVREATAALRTIRRQLEARLRTR